jgi:large subunit ribosomal protein L25
MKSYKISGSVRKDLGKKGSKNLRKDEKVPCVMYGGDEVIHFESHINNFIHIVYTPDVYLVELDLDGKQYKAIMQDIQFHPVTDKIIHIDFKQVFDNQPAVVNLPIELNGSAAGILAGGKLRQRRRSLKAKGLVKDMPDKLVIDITNVDVGDVIKIQDLSYENLELLDPPRAMVMGIVTSRVAAKGFGEEPVEEEAEGAEGAEGAETTEGETPKAEGGESAGGGEGSSAES